MKGLDMGVQGPTWGCCAIEEEEEEEEDTRHLPEETEIKPKRASVRTTSGQDGTLTRHLARTVL
jgi:hypothetical protein